MSTDEQWLRATLTEPDVAPPPDLADRAERAARGIRRRRVAATALAAAVLVAVPLAVQGSRGPDRTAGPTPTPTPEPVLDCLGHRIEPAPPTAVSAADVDWPYRGDADLEQRTRALGAGLTDVRPLYGARPDGDHALLVVAGRDAAGWRLRYAVEGTGAGTAEDALPALRPATALSFFLQADQGIIAGDRQLTGPVGPAPTDTIGNQLVVLAAPGSARIRYSTCPGPPGSTYGSGSSAGDTSRIYRNPGDPVGVLEIDRVGSPTLALGPPTLRNGSGRHRPDSVPAIPVPAGHHVLPGPYEGVSYAGTTTASGVRVLARCQGWSDRMLVTGAVGEHEVQCDGLVQVVAADHDFGPGFILTAGPRDAFAYQLLVVAPDR